ncbi:MAG: hypothetical protein ABMB14_36090, partial [Myxococcota bacterium]
MAYPEALERQRSRREAIVRREAPEAMWLLEHDPVVTTGRRDAGIDRARVPYPVVGTERGGLVTTLRRGEAPVLARFEGAYAATTITVMGDRTGFAWKQPETWNK